MKVLQTKLPDVYCLIPQRFGDARGWFTESWSRRDMRQAGLDYDFVQDNHSFSQKKGTLRGLHFQRSAFAQAMLLRCIRGAVLDVAVDLRKGSPTFLQWAAEELSAENGKQLLIPRGFGHAFLTLTDDVEVLYKADNFYAPEADCSIRWDDPDIAIDWPIRSPILSQKDQNAPLLRDFEIDFVYEKEKTT